MAKQEKNKKDATKDPSSLENFRYHYDNLQETVGLLQDGEVENIDELIPLVEKATESYKSCMARLDAVSKLLEGHFEKNHIE